MTRLTGGGALLAAQRVILTAPGVGGRFALLGAAEHRDENEHRGALQPDVGRALDLERRPLRVSADQHAFCLTFE